MVGCDFQSMSHPRVAIITGGGRGIGAAAAKLAAARGYAVCVNYRQNHEAASRVVADIEAAGGRAVAIAADVSVESEIVRLFGAATAALGPVTALVNSAVASAMATNFCPTTLVKTRSQRASSRRG